MDKDIIKIRFPKGVEKVCVPFMINVDVFQKIHEKIEQIKYPKKVKTIEGRIICKIDLKNRQMGHHLAEIIISK